MAAKEVPEIVMKERAINYYQVQKDEEMLKKKEKQQKYREGLDHYKMLKDRMEVNGKMTKIEK